MVIVISGSGKGQTWPLKEIAKTRITAPAAFDVPSLHPSPNNYHFPPCHRRRWLYLEGHVSGSTMGIRYTCRRQYDIEL